MPKVIETNFSAGEISPRYGARVDSEQYQNGAETIENGLVLPQGCILRRPGFEFVNRTKANGEVRFIEFVDSNTDKYLIEVGDGYMRFIKNGSQIVETATQATITDITAFATLLVTAGGHGFEDDDEVWIADVVGMTEVNGRVYRVDNKGANDFDADTVSGNTVDGSSYTPYVSGGTATRIYTLDSPYSLADLDELMFIQSANTIFLVHPDHQPRTLTRTSDTDWNLLEMPFFGGPFLSQNTSGTKITPNGTTGNITLSAGDIVVNGNFATDPFAADGGWVDDSYGTGTATWVANTLELQTAAGSLGDYGRAYQIINVAKNTDYTLTFDAALVAGSDFGDYFIRTGYLGGSYLVGVTNIVAGANSVTFNSGANTSLYLFYRAYYVAAGTFSIDNVSTGVGTIFNADHVGALWKISHSSKIESVTGSFTAASQQSAALELSTGEFTLSINDGAGGGWGSVDLEKSLDGSTWVKVTTYSANVDLVTITDPTPAIQYRLNCTAYTGTPTIDYDMTQVTSLYTGIVRITAYTSPSVVEATVLEPLYSTDATTLWAEGSWSDYRGWPEFCVFYENRLVMAATADQPNTLWGSQSDDYTNFGVTIYLADNESWSYTLLSRQIHPIRWLATAQNKLRVGTARSEWWIAGKSDSEPLTPKSVRAVEETYFGSSDIVPLKVSSAILTIDFMNRIMFEFKYDFAADVYDGTDLIILAEHLARESKIIKMAYQRSPYTIIWALREDGVLLGLTYDRTNKVAAWHKHEISGQITAETAYDIYDHGFIEDISVIPGSDKDEVYAVVRREIADYNSAPVYAEKIMRYIERMGPQFNGIRADTGLLSDSYKDSNNWNDDYTNGVLTLLIDTGWGIGDSSNLRGVFGFTPFVAGDVGKHYKIKSASGDVCEVAITSYVSTSHVVVENISAIPATLRAQLNDIWAECISTATNMEHLEGETLDVLLDGVPDRITVLGGELVLGGYYARVIAGLNYETKIKTLKISFGGQGGTIQGVNKRINWLNLRLDQSRGGTVGPNEDNLYAIPYSDSSIVYPNPPATFSEDVPIDYDGDFETQGQVVIVQDQPLPLCLLGLCYGLDVYDRG